MEYLYWVLIGIGVITVLFGLKSLIVSLMDASGSYSLKSLFFIILFILLMCAPSLLKEFAPEYYGYSIWVLIFYIVGFILYSRREKNKSEEG